MRSFVDTSVYFITPSCYIQTIDKIYYQTNEAMGKFMLTQENQNAIEDEKEKFRQEEYKVLLKLKKTIPGYYLKDNEKKTAGYVELKKE